MLSLDLLSLKRAVWYRRD